MHITLNGGRTIALARLEQSLTYGGLLAGRPTEKTDAMQIRALLAEVQRHLHEGARPVLLSPAGSPLAHVTSIAFFRSDALAKPGSEPYSSLAVVWFQDAFGPPIAEEVLVQIKALDWESLARDWNW